MFRFHQPHRFMARQANGRLRPAWVRWLLFCCALQVFMAMLGQMHQVAHAPRAEAALAAWKTGVEPLNAPGITQDAAHGFLKTADQQAAGDAVAGDSVVGNPGAGDPETSGVERWFGVHGSADCELFHHLALGPAMAGMAIALHTFLFAPVRNACMGAVLLRQSPALFFARGPPMALFHF